MRRKFALGVISFAFITGVLSTFAPTELIGQRRRVVVRTVRPVRPVVRTTRLVVRPGYPIRRVLPAAVVVRPVRRVVAVRAPLVFLPAVVWTQTLAVAPSGDRLIWQDSETIDSDEGWVDTNLGVDSSGDALFLSISGKAKLNFAEVTFASGNVQVVDFDEKTYNPNVYKLLDFADGRHVSTIRILAKAESDESTLTVYLSK